jgi:hypothetical protein
MTSRQNKGVWKVTITQKAILDAKISELVNLWRKGTVNSAGQYIYRSCYTSRVYKAQQYPAPPKTHTKTRENFVEEVSEVERWMKHHPWKAKNVNLSYK